MHTLFINLDRDTDRLSKIESNLQKNHIEATRLPAVNWNELKKEEQSRLYDEKLNKLNYYKPLANGEKGCYASHIKAWEILLSSPNSSLLVLEDDIDFEEGFKDVINFIENFKEPWDMIKLLSRPLEKYKTHTEITKKYRLIDYQRVPSWTAGYVISRNGAQKLLQSRVPFGRPIDVDLRFWFENDLNILGVHPSPLILDETSDTSSIWLGQQSNSLTLRQKIKKISMKAKMNWGYILHK